MHIATASIVDAGRLRPRYHDTKNCDTLEQVFFFFEQVFDSEYNISLRKHIDDPWARDFRQNMRQQRTEIMEWCVKNDMKMFARRMGFYLMNVRGFVEDASGSSCYFSVDSRPF